MLCNKLFAIATAPMSKILHLVMFSSFTVLLLIIALANVVAPSSPIAFSITFNILIKVLYIKLLAIATADFIVANVQYF